MDNKYPIAKSDRKPIPLTTKEKLKRKRKCNAKSSKMNKALRWERIRLLPELWTRRDISQRLVLCSQCHLRKNIRQFNMGFSRICIMCRKPNMPPIDKTRLVYPVK